MPGSLGGFCPLLTATGLLRLFVRSQWPKQSLWCLRKTSRCDCFCSDEKNGWLLTQDCHDQTKWFSEFKLVLLTKETRPTCESTPKVLRVGHETHLCQIRKARWQKFSVYLHTFLVNVFGTIQERNEAKSFCGSCTFFHYVDRDGISLSGWKC